MACWENKAIADEAGLSPAQLTEITSKFGIGSLAKTELAHAEHATDFDPPIYNVWKRESGKSLESQKKAGVEKNPYA